MLNRGDDLQAFMAKLSSPDVLLDELSRRFGEHIALISAQTSQSYRYDQLCSEISRRAKKLQHYGMKAGALVLLPAPKKASFESILWWLAGWKLGLTVVMSNPNLDPDTQKALQNNNTFDYVLTKAVLADILLLAEKPLPSRPALTLDAPANGVFTSGSTGTPKLAILSIYQQVSSALAVNQRIPLASGDRNLLTLPLYHVAGMALVLRTFMAGATVVVSSAMTLGILKSQNISHVSLVATQLHRLLADIKACSEYSCDSLALSAILLGGSHIPEALIQQAKAVFHAKVRCFTSYGMTEAASAVSICELQPNKKGKIEPYFCQNLAHAQLTLSAEHEVLVAARLPGKSLCLGYLEQNQLTPLTTQNGWFHTKDLGRSQPPYGMSIVGRLDNQFICGGENVQAETIEAFLLQQADVCQVMVVPVSDQEYGQRGFAFIEYQAGATHAFEALSMRCEALPFYQRPVSFSEFPAALQHSNALKPNRKALARLAHSRIHHDHA